MAEGKIAGTSRTRMEECTALLSAVRAAQLRDRIIFAFLVPCLIAGIALILLAEQGHTAERYEYVWLGTGVIGAVFVLWMMRDLVADRAVLRADNVNGGDIMLNTTAIGINLFLFAVVSCVTLIGVIAIVIPTSPGTSPAATLTPIHVTYTVGLFGISLCTDACALWMRFRRRLFRSYLEHKYAARTLTEIIQSRT